MDGSLSKFETDAASALGGGEVARAAARMAARENEGCGRVVRVFLEEVEEVEPGHPEEESEWPSATQAAEEGASDANESSSRAAGSLSSTTTREFAVPSMFQVPSATTSSLVRMSDGSGSGSSRFERERKKTVKPSVFSFDNAHPAIASQHYLRTKAQDELLRQSIEGALNSPRLRKRRPKKKKRRSDGGLRSRSLGDLDLSAGPSGEGDRRGRRVEGLERAAEEIGEESAGLSSPERGESRASAEEDWRTIQRLEGKILQLQSGIDVLKRSQDFKDFWEEVTVPSSPEPTAQRSVTFVSGDGSAPETPWDGRSPVPGAKIVVPGILKRSSEGSEALESPLPSAEADQKGKGRAQARPMSAPPGGRPGAGPSSSEIASDSDSDGGDLDVDLEVDFSPVKKDEWKPIITRPKPFSFLSRDEERKKTKPISTVKMEQDLMIKECDARGKKKASTFKAKKIPKSVLEARYENMVKEQATMRMMKHEEHKRKQREMQKPFAFDLVDKKRQEIKQKKIREAQEKKGRVKPFRANAVPASTYEPRYELLQMEKQRRGSRVEERARRLLAESKMPPRMDVEHSCPIPRAKASKVIKSPAKKRPGTSDGGIPDYKKLHAEFEERLSQAKARNQLKRTVVKEFNLGGRTREECEANQRRVERKMRRILADIELDAQDLKELRWPYMSTRAKVRPTRPNFDRGCSFQVGETLAVRLKAAEVRKAKERGQFDTREEKEARKERKRLEEEKRRKKAWRKLKQIHEAARAVDFGEDEVGADLGGGARASGRREELSGPSQDDLVPPTVEDKSYSKTSAQHVIARHKQVAKRAQEIVEKALLAQGVDAYNFVREPSDMK